LAKADGVSLLSQIRLLFELQQIDLSISLRQSEIQDLEGQLKETGNLLKAKKELEEKQCFLEDQQKAQGSLEDEIEDLQAKIKPLSQKLFDGSVKNPKELASLKQDYEHQKSIMDAKEDAVLQIMLAIDKARQEINTKSREVKELEKARQEEQARIHARIDDLKSALSELEQERQALISRMEPAFFKLYSNLRVKKPRPVAKIEKGMCQGCRVTLPVSLIQRARVSDEPVFCCNCERILYAG
jgi:hypothetical protein